MFGSHVHWCPDVSDRDLAVLYDHCHVFLCPSLEEGCGLPVVEALAHGCHVISADRGALPEAGHGHTILLDPVDEAAWFKAIRGVASSRRVDVQGLTLPTWDSATAVIRTALTSFVHETLEQ